MSFFKSVYLTNKTFIVLGICILLFSLGLLVEITFFIGQILLFLLLIIVLVEAILLYSKSKLIDCRRILPSKLSNGDENQIELIIKNQSLMQLKLIILEDLPQWFQLRTWKIKEHLNQKQSKSIQYKVKPTERGIYLWENTYLMVEVANLGFLSRKFTFEASNQVSCYPSFEQFKRLPIKSMIANYNNNVNDTHIRKIGQSLEFEQIKNYVNGDNYRHINWKASAKSGKLMLNQYQEERSQDIYMVIDMGRSMKMPFEKQTLLDYAINGSVALAKTILDVKDKAGLITFSSKECTLIPARSEYKQFTVINDALYHLESDFLESDFEKLYKYIRIKVKQRSLLVIFTNFDSINSLQRNLSYLKAIAKYHLVMVVFFENSEIVSLANEQAIDAKGIYNSTIAKQFLSQNLQILRELVKSGIQGLYTAPQNLSVQVINKYIQIKHKQII
jgi:uncharacterized protein (DUF58 family)